MNELKPEDVIKALECCERRDCERCNYKQRCGDACVLYLCGDALALLRLREDLIKASDEELAEKDAEIDRLRNSITFQVVMPDEKMEEIKAECLKRVELDIKAIKAEAISEFAEKLKEAAKYIPWCDYTPVINCIDEIAEKLKGETDG